MAYEAENAIFQRLSQAMTFHPASVSLFTPDWTLEPGDVVKVLSGEEEYDVPIYTMDLTWNGTAKTDIQSTGNQERQPLSALRRQEYQNARRGYGAARQVQEELDEQVHQYQHFVEETDVYRQSVYKIMGVTYDENGNVIYQTDPVTGEPILDAAGNPIPVYDENSNGSITGKVLQTAQNYTSLYQLTLNASEFDPTATYQIGDMVMRGGVVYKFTAAHTGDWTGLDVAVVPSLQSQITQNAQEISQKVSSGDLAGYLTITAAQTKLGNVIEWEDGSLKVAEVVTSINTYTGDTTVKIKGDKIELDGAAIIGAINGATQPDPEGGGEQTVLAISADKITLNGTDVIAALNAANGSLTPYGVTAYEVDSAEFGIWDPSSNDVTTLGLRTVSIGPGTSSIDPESGETIYSGKQIKFLADTTFSQATSITYADFPHYHTMTVENGVLTLGDVVSTSEENPGNTVTLPSALITDVSVSNNILTITKADGSEVNFSKATTLTGGWGSGDTGPNGLFTVSATQTNLNTTTNETETTEVGNYSFKFSDTGGTANAVFDVELGTITASNLGNSYGTVPIYIGTYTESGAMTHQVEINRTTLISSELRNVWTQSGFDTGYAAGQANAAAVIYNGEITYARNDTQYAASKLFVDVSAFPALLLTDTAEPPNTTTTVGSKVTDTIEIPVTVTAATLTSTYANGTYTVTKSSGGKVSVDGADIDVGVTSYPISAATAIADGRNSVEVGTALLNDPVFVTDTTQAHDKKYTISGTVQLNYQSGVDGSGNPVYTNIGNPVTIKEKNITGVYNDGYASGWEAAFEKVTLPASEQTRNAYMDVFTPPQTVDGNAVSQRYTVSVDGSYAYIKTGNPAVTVARVVNTGATVVQGEITGIVLNEGQGERYTYDTENVQYTVNLQATGTNISNSPYIGTVNVSADAAYGHGWRQARNQVSIPTAQQTANAYIDIGYPTSTVDGTAGSQRYTVSVDNDYAYIKAGNTTVARVENTGVAPAATKVHKGNWSVGSVQFTPSSDANDPTAYSLSLEISASLGTTASTTLSVKETSVTPNVSTGATKALYLKVKDDYVYILNENAEPNLATNVLSRAVNTGYENGQNSVTVTDASLVENLVVYDENSRTAIGPVDVTLSNGKQVRLEGIDFSNAYQAGLDGDSSVTSQTYEFELEDGDMFWNGVEHDIDVSAVYQQGVEDATPTTQYYAYIRRSVGSAAIGFYKPYKANPSLPSKTMWGQGLKKDTEVLLLSTEPVRSGSTNYYYVMYDGFPGYISSSFFTDRPVYHTPAQGDHGGWYNNAKPTPAITGVTIQSIKHTAGYSGTVQILLQPDYGTSGKYNSTYVSSSDYNAIQVTTDENIETYLNKVYTTYYAVHSYNVYASDIPHKVTFNVTTEIGTKKVVLEFNSCAKVPSIQTITLQGMIHNRMDYIDDITVRVDPVYASARNTTSTAVQAAEYANTPVTDSNTDVYMEYVYSTYYGTHSSRTYNTSLGHKATFLVTYDIGDSQNVTVQFVSYAKQPAVTSTTLDWIRHYAGTYSGGIEVKCAQRGKSASERTSEASEQYNNLTVTDEPGTYLSLIDGSNYGRHSNYYYNRRLEHKACFTVRYDDGYSEEHIVRFESAAVAPSVSYVEITRVCHVNQFYNGSFAITEMKDNAWFTTYATSVSDTNGDYISTAVSGSVFDNLSVNGNASDYFDPIAGSGLTAIYGEHFIKSKPTGTTENKMQMTVYYSDGHSGNVTIRFYTRPVAETWEETGMTVNSIVHPRGAYTDDIVITYATIFSGVTATKNSEYTNSMPSKTSTHSYFTYATHDRGLYNTDLNHAARITVTSKSNYGNTKTENIVDTLGSRAV